MKKPFLNTIIGSWCKVFISAVLTQYLIILNNPELTLISMESLSALGIAGSLATVPVIINYFNPNDPRYGSKRKMEDQ